MGISRSRRASVGATTTAPDGPRSLDDLLGDIGTGDVDAFGQLYDQLAPIVYGVCLRLLKDPLSAQAAAEESFVQLWQQAPRFRPDCGQVQGWARSIALRCSADLARLSAGSAG